MLQKKSPQAVPLIMLGDAKRQKHLIGVRQVLNLVLNYPLESNNVAEVEYTVSDYLESSEFKGELETKKIYLQTRMRLLAYT